MEKITTLEALVNAISENEEFNNYSFTLDHYCLNINDESNENITDLTEKLNQSIVISALETDIDNIINEKLIAPIIDEYREDNFHSAAEKFYNESDFDGDGTEEEQIEDIAEHMASCDASELMRFYYLIFPEWYDGMQWFEDIEISPVDEDGDRKITISVPKNDLGENEITFYL